MIEFVKDYDDGHSIWFDTEDEKDRILKALKRGMNTWSPLSKEDMEIIRLIGEMEK